MEITIRKMIKADLEQVYKIEKEVFSNPWSYQSLQAEINKNNYKIYLTACQQDKVLAYIGSWILPDGLHITTIACKKKYRRKKIALRLLQELLKRAKNKGIKRVTLEVRVSNKAAINLYKKNGFQAVGCRPKYYRNNNEDALIMWKELKND